VLASGAKSHQSWSGESEGRAEEGKLVRADRQRDHLEAEEAAGSMSLDLVWIVWRVSRSGEEAMRQRIAVCLTANIIAMRLLVC
jgi:hypothetical protein